MKGRIQHETRLLTAAFWIIVAVMLLSFPASAALGDTVDSVEIDRAHMQGSIRVIQSDAYVVNEIQAATGTVVREYVSGGAVFAVAWQGPTIPDLRQLLGAYFDQYLQAAEAAQAQRRDRGPLLIQSPGLVFESGGHMRSFRGRAYIPAMLPRGVAAETIR